MVTQKGGPFRSCPSPPLHFHFPYRPFLPLSFVEPTPLSCLSPVISDVGRDRAAGDQDAIVLIDSVEIRDFILIALQCRSDSFCPGDGSRHVKLFLAACVCHASYVLCLHTDQGFDRSASGLIMQLSQQTLNGWVFMMR